MNLNQWYFINLWGSFNARYIPQLAYKIINSQEDRIAYNRSLVQLRFTNINNQPQYGAWNGNDGGSWYEFDGGNRFNTATRYDWRNMSAGVRYFINDGNSAFTKGSEYTFYVYHNADGTRNLPIYCYFHGGVSGSFSYAEGGGTVGLPTIPRASTPTIGSNPTNIESNLDIYTNRVSTSFTHTIDITFGSFYRQITGVGDNFVWNTNDNKDALYQQIPNNLTGNGTITLYTYSGGTHIGTKSIGFSLRVPNSSAPTFGDFSFKDINSITKALTGDDQKIILGYSNIEVLCNTAVAKNYASINSYKARIGTKTVSSTNTTISFGSTVLSDKLIATAVDSRGLETSVEKTPLIIPYSKIILNVISVLRQNGVDPTVNMKINGVISKLMVNGVDKNKIKTMKYRTKLTSSDTWGSWTTFTGGLVVNEDGSFEITRVLSETFNQGNSYNVEFYIEDELDFNTIIGVVIKSTPLISFRDKQIGIDKVPENGALDVAGDIYQNGRQVLDYDVIDSW